MIQTSPDPFRRKETVVENSPARTLFLDAMSGKIDRREVLKRAAALGLTTPVAVFLAQAAAGAGIQSALAAEEGKPSTTFYSWMLQYHPDIVTIGKENGYEVQTAPTTNFG